MYWKFGEKIYQTCTKQITFIMWKRYIQTKDINKKYSMSDKITVTYMK